MGDKRPENSLALGTGRHRRHHGRVRDDGRVLDILDGCCSRRCRNDLGRVVRRFAGDGERPNQPILTFREGKYE